MCGGTTLLLCAGAAVAAVAAAAAALGAVCARASDVCSTMLRV